MLQNGYLLAKIGADTAENEQNFADRPSRGERSTTDAVASRGKAAIREETAA